jgi:hypothetical protein
VFVWVLLQNALLPLPNEFSVLSNVYREINSALHTTRKAATLSLNRTTYELHLQFCVFTFGAALFQGFFLVVT